MTIKAKRPRNLGRPTWTAAEGPPERHLALAIARIENDEIRQIFSPPEGEPRHDSAEFANPRLRLAPIPELVLFHQVGKRLVVLGDLQPLPLEFPMYGALARAHGLMAVDFGPCYGLFHRGSPLSFALADRC